jgi:hypothetical protein
MWPMGWEPLCYSILGPPWWSSGSVIDNGPKIWVQTWPRVMDFLRVIKIDSTTSFRAEIKLIYVIWLYGMLKSSTGMKEILCGQNLVAISHQVSPALLVYDYWYLPESSGGRIRNDQISRWGCTIDQIWSPCAPTPHRNKVGHLVNRSQNILCMNYKLLTYYWISIYTTPNSFKISNHFNMT